MQTQRRQNGSPDSSSDISDDGAASPPRQGRGRNAGFAARLENLLLGREQAAIARNIGVSKSVLGDWRKGSMPAGDKLFRLADELDVDPRWLATGEGSPARGTGGRDESEWVNLPRFDIFRFAGAERPEPVEQVPIRRDQLATAVRVTSGLWLADMPSDAMADIAREGETIICRDPDVPLADGRVYVMLLDGRPIVRRVQVRPEGLVLKATAPDIDPITLPPDRLDQLVPIGRVLAAVSLQAV